MGIGRPDMRMTGFVITLSNTGMQGKLIWSSSRLKVRHVSLVTDGLR